MQVKASQAHLPRLAIKAFSAQNEASCATGYTKNFAYLERASLELDLFNYSPYASQNGSMLHRLKAAEAQFKEIVEENNTPEKKQSNDVADFILGFKIPLAAICTLAVFASAKVSPKLGPFA